MIFASETDIFAQPPFLILSGSVFQLTTPFKENNPTAENIAKYFYSELSTMINTNDIRLKSFKLWETDKYAVEYME